MNLVVNQFGSDLGTEIVPQPALRVLIDARKINDGGIGVYTRNLIIGLLAQSSVEITLIGRREEISKYDWSKWVDILEDGSRSYSIEELLLLGRRIDCSKYDLFHSPHFTLPFGIKIPCVVTVHDLIHVRYPEKRFYPWIAKPLIKSAIKRASRVLTVSQATYADLVGLAPQSSVELAEKLRVIPNAVDPYFVKKVAAGIEDVSDYLASHFGLRGRYLLCVLSNAKPHKAARDLIEAFSAVKELAFSPDFKRNPKTRRLARALADLKLVFVGKGSESLVSDVFQKEPDGIFYYGMVQRDELAYLYSGAQALVVPSMAEGFCLPVLEAHAFGTPVICRPVAAILELLGPQDFVARDFSIAALQDLILKFADEASSNEKSPAAALRGVEGYMVQEIGKAVLAVYREAVEGSK